MAGPLSEDAAYVDAVEVVQTGDGLEVNRQYADSPEELKRQYMDRFSAGASSSEGVAGRAPFCRTLSEARETGVPQYQDKVGVYPGEYDQVD